jgi:hypothetical protein
MFSVKRATQRLLITPIRRTSRRMAVFTPTVPVAMSLDEFRDTVPRQQRAKEMVGRSWGVTELRRKSYDDLHKLWYVYLKKKLKYVLFVNWIRESVALQKSISLSNYGHYFLAHI